MTRFSIVCIGSAAFSVPSFQALANDRRFYIPVVLTQPDKKAGRGLRIKTSPVKEFAIKNKLFVQTPKRIQEAEKVIRGAKPDFLIVVAYGEIFPQSLLDMPRFAPVNVHASLLPKYRGASPVQETLLHGDKKTGITIIRMTSDLDAGLMLLKKSIPIDDDDTYESLSRKLSGLAAELLPDLLNNYAAGNVKEIPQPDEGVSYCRKIRKEDGRIDLKNEEAKDIVQKIRAYTPWPGCFIELSGKRLKIVQAHYNEQKNSSELYRLEDDKIAFQTKKGILYPEQVQLEGKRAMDIAEFLHGHKKLFNL